MKVIYLPDRDNQDFVTVAGGIEELVSTRLEPGADPVAEAKRRGTILAIIRLGNVDLENRISPAMNALPPMLPPGFPPGMMPGMLPPGVPPGMLPPGTPLPLIPKTGSGPGLPPGAPSSLPPGRSSIGGPGLTPDAPLPPLRPSLPNTLPMFK